MKKIITAIICALLFFLILSIQVSSLYGEEPYKFLLKWGKLGGEPGQFWEPWRIAVDSFGNVYVADSNNNRIQKFDSNGNFITTWGTGGVGSGEFNKPWGIAVDSSDNVYVNVYVADRGNNRIQKFTSSGTWIATWGSPVWQFNYPSDVAVDSGGYVYVVEPGSWRIQKFDSNGNFIRK